MSSLPGTSNAQSLPCNPLNEQVDAQWEGSMRTYRRTLVISLQNLGRQICSGIWTPQWLAFPKETEQSVSPLKVEKNLYLSLSSAQSWPDCSDAPKIRLKTRVWRKFGVETTGVVNYHRYETHGFARLHNHWNMAEEIRGEAELYSRSNRQLRKTGLKRFFCRSDHFRFHWKGGGVEDDFSNWFCLLRINSQRAMPWLHTIRTL